jgi:hypothetical protein
VLTIENIDTAARWINEQSAADRSPAMQILQLTNIRMDQFEEWTRYYVDKVSGSALSELLDEAPPAEASRIVMAMLETQLDLGLLTAMKAQQRLLIP